MFRAAVAGGVAMALSCVPAVEAAAAPARTSGPVRGVDISAYQHVGPPINWRQIARDGIRFVSVKASEGTYYRNPFYASDTRAAASAGLVVLPYVFANPAQSRGAQTARFAVSVTGRRGPARLPLVVDLENDPYKKKADCYRLSRPRMIAWIGGFLNQARALTGRWPVIYTTADWWQECTGATGRFRHSPLWLAAFGPSAPPVPSPWHRWAFWQYADNGRLAGIGQVDLDYYQPTDALPALHASPRKTTPKAKHRKPGHRKPGHRKPGHR
jgi:GH25 family lysozyme M1 (1,4-beta-N-acetylmuramidase)